MSFEIKGIVVPALLMGAIYGVVTLLVKVVSLLSRKFLVRQAPPRPTESPDAYDKAKWHMESVSEGKLPLERAFNHTTFFFSWLVRNGLISQSLERSRAKDLAGYRSGQLSINDIYAGLDACLLSSMLSDEGNAFAKSYFDFQRGLWMSDLETTLPNASQYGVDYTPENETLIHAVISKRFAEWQQSQRAA